MNSTTQFTPAARGAFLPAISMAGAKRRQGYAPAAVGHGSQTFAGRAYGTPAFMGQVRLGQTAETWYKRAGSALAQFRYLKEQIQTINNQAGRDSIIMWLGSQSIDESPEYRYATVNQNYTVDANVNDEGIAAYDSSQRQGRVEKLEKINNDFSARIDAARSTYGRRAVPGTGGVATAPAPMDLTLPIVGVGVLIAGVLLLS